MEDCAPHVVTVPPLWRCSPQELREWYAGRRLTTSPHSPESLTLDDWIEFRDRDLCRHQEAVKRSATIMALGYEVPVKELRLATPRSGLGSKLGICLTKQPDLETLPFWICDFTCKMLFVFLCQRIFRLLEDVMNAPKAFHEYVLLLQNLSIFILPDRVSGL